MKSLRILAALAAFFLPNVLFGQAYTNITASNVGMTDGKICFLGTDANDNPITYTPQGSSPISGPICGTVTNSSLSGSLQVANTLTASPSGMSYRMTLVNGDNVYLTVRNVPVSGASWDFGSYILPATAIALGYGTPAMLCAVGAQFVSTDRQPSNWVCALNGSTTVWQSYPSQGYCPANSAYLTPKKGSAFCVAYQSSGQGEPTGACTQSGLYFQQDAGQAFLWSCVNGVWTHLVSGDGTVKSIGIAVPPQMTVSGSPVTGSGTITLGMNTTGSGSRVATATNNGNPSDCVSWDSNGNVSDAGAPCVTFISEPANTVFAAPDGLDGIPSFRHIVVHDLPFSYSGSTTELATVSGSLISGSVVAVGANGNLVNATSSTQFPGIIPNPSQVQGLAPSATIDTTNASNISSGTLNIARLSGAVFTCPTGQVIQSFTLNNNATTPVCSTAGGTVNIGNYGFLPYYSDTPQGAALSADTVAKTDGNGNMVANTLQLSSGGSQSVLTINALGGANAGCLYTDSAGNVISTKNGCGVNGTVTSVGLSMPDTNIFTVSNTPITSSGVITAQLNAQAQQTFLAGPIEGSAASPAFRALALTDIPGSPEPDPSGGGDIGSYIMAGPIYHSPINQPFGYWAPRWRHLDARDFGAISPNLFLAGPSSGSGGIASLRAITTADLPKTIFNAAPTLCGANQAAQGIDAQGNAAGCFTVAGGSVLSVGLSLPNIFSVSGSPVTTSGTLTATLSPQSGNLIFASPNGGSGVPNFRAMTAADLPASFNAPTATALAATPNQCTGGLLATGIDAQGNANCTSAGVVTSVGLSLPSIFAVSGSPVTTTGTLTATLASQSTGNLVFATPNSTAGVPSFRGLTAADLPSSYTAPKATALATTPTTCAAGTYASGVDAQGNAICASAGSVTSVGLSLPSIFTITNSPVTTTGNLSASFSSQAQNLIFASPNGSTGAPLFRGLATADLPGAIAPSTFHLMYGESGCSIPSESSSYAMTAFGCAAGSPYQLSGIAFGIVPTVPGSGPNRSSTGFRFYNAHESGTPTFTSAMIANDVQQSGGADTDNINFYSNGPTLTATIPSSGGLVNPSSGVFGWQPGNNAVTTTDGSPDTAFTRCGADCIAAGNGTAGDTSATIGLGSINFGSSVGSFGPSGNSLALSPATGMHFQVNSDTTITGAAILNNTLSVASTSNLNATNFGANATLLALNPATATQNYGSTSLQFKGSFWNGSAAADTLWTIQNQVGSGTTPDQTLIFTASGSSGAAAVSVPGLAIGSLNGCLTATNGVVSSTGTACGLGGGSGGAGTVTSFSAGNLAPLFTTSVGTPTTTPALSFALSDAPAHTFFGNTASGSASPSFSAITAADLPVLPSSNLPSDVAYIDATNTFTSAQTFSSNATFAGNVTISGLTAGRCVQAGTGGVLSVTSNACQQGTVTSVGISVPTQMTVTGSPITTSGTIALGLNTSGTGSKVATASTTGTSGHVVTWTSSGDLGYGGVAGSVSSVGLSMPAIFTVTGSPVTSSGMLTATLASETANYLFAAPNGSVGAPTFRALVGADLPSPINTITSSQSANLFLAAPSTGTGVPSFRAMANADLPSGALKTSNGAALSSGYCLQTTTGGLVTVASGACANIVNLVTTNTNQSITGQKSFSSVPLFKNGITITNSVGDTWQVASPAPASGNGTFSAKVDTGAGTSPYDIETGDFNGDGNLDFALATSGVASVYVYLGNGDGTFNQTSYSVNSAPHTLGIGDFNSDGLPDIVTDRGYVLLNNGAGVFSASPNTVPLTGSSQAIGIAVADLNNDGYADFVGGYSISCTSQMSDVVDIAKNNKDGTFTITASYQFFYTTGCNGGQVDTIYVNAADLNNDGYPDIIATTPQRGAMWVLLNKGDGTFFPPVQYAANTSPAYVTAVDVNGDGYKDLLVANSGSNVVSLFINKGDGTFNAKVAYTVGSTPFKAVAVDINGDKHPDLLATNYGSATVSVLLNNGDGTFATKLDYTTGTQPIGLAVNDFTNSGIASIVTANYGAASVSFLRGLGTTSSTNILNFQHTAGSLYGAIEVPQILIPSGSYTGNLISTALTANRTYAIPDATGTLALTSQLPLSGTTANLGGSALTAGQCTSGTVAISGATTSMAAAASPVSDPDTSGTGVDIYAFVSSTNTVTVRVCAITSGTPAATAYNVRVIP